MQSKQLSLMILMPEKQISAIIGRDGNTIKQIRNETMEAKIHISAKSVTSSDRAVSVRGDSISVNKACKLICLELGKGTQDIGIMPCSKLDKALTWVQLNFLRPNALTKSLDN